MLITVTPKQIFGKLLDPPPHPQKFVSWGREINNKNRGGGEEISPRRIVGPITGPKKAKFLEKGPKIRKNLPISKKRALPKKTWNKPWTLMSIINT